MMRLGLMTLSPAVSSPFSAFQHKDFRRNHTLTILKEIGEGGRFLLSI